eukprot:11411414-Heterocapsa_arctica.AAC.1
MASPPCATSAAGVASAAGRSVLASTIALPQWPACESFSAPGAEAREFVHADDLELEDGVGDGPT